jgi:hypothetical protein
LTSGAALSCIALNSGQPEIIRKLALGVKSGAYLPLFGSCSRASKVIAPVRDRIATTFG